MNKTNSSINAKRWLILFAVFVNLLMIFMISQNASAASSVVEHSNAVMNTAALTVLIASLVNAVVPVKYRGFVDPIIRILSLSIGAAKGPKSDKRK